MKQKPVLITYICLIGAIIILIIDSLHDFVLIGYSMLLMLGLLVTAVVFAVKALRKNKKTGNYFLLILTGILLLIFSYPFVLSIISIATGNTGKYAIAPNAETYKYDGKPELLNELPQEMINMAKRESQNFLESVLAGNPKLTKTETGLIYEILKPGSDTRSSNTDDMYVIEWEKLLRSGEPVPSPMTESGTLKYRIEVTLDEIPLGIGEGLRLIGTGGRIKLYIPGNLMANPYEEIHPQQNEGIYLIDLIEIKTSGTAKE